MGGSKYKNVNPVTIKNILTLRYNPVKKTLLPKLTWKDFKEKQIGDSTNFIEKSIEDYIRNEIGYSKKKISIALSGGIDSTLILAILRKTLPHIEIDAISISFAESIDESRKAAKIAEKFEANHHIVFIENYLEELPKEISIIKLPFWDLHWYHVVKKAKSLSHPLISGDGGDELFGGYTFRYEKFLSSIGLKSSTSERMKAYLECHERDWVPNQEKMFGKKIRFSWNEIYKILEPFFDNPLSPLLQVFLADFNGKLLYNWLPNNTKFHDYFGIKAILPFLSKNLISYSTHLPHHLKYNRQKNIGKLSLRKILGKYVSKSFITDTKQGFSINTTNLWKSNTSKLCDYYLSEARIVKEGWINKDWIEPHIKKLESDTNVRYVNKFMGLLALEIWFRLFMTKEIKSDSLLN